MMSLERLCVFGAHPTYSHTVPDPMTLASCKKGMRILTHLAEEGKQAKTEATKGYKRKVNAILNHGIWGLTGELG